jgi:hypothetical protein
MAASGYVVKATNANITGTDVEDIGAGTDATDIGVITSFSMEPSTNLRQVPSFEGVQLIPDIPTMRIGVSSMISEGSSTATVLTALNSQTTADLDINGIAFNNTYYVGGQVNTLDFDQGQKGLQVTKIFLAIGEAPTS